MAVRESVKPRQDQAPQVPLDEILEIKGSGYLYELIQSWRKIHFSGQAKKRCGHGCGQYTEICNEMCHF